MVKLELKKNKFNDQCVIMLMSLDRLDTNPRVLFFLELLKYLEPEGCVVESKAKGNMMSDLVLSREGFNNSMSALAAAGHLRRDGGVIYPHPKYLMVMKSDYNLLITTKGE